MILKRIKCKSLQCFCEYTEWNKTWIHEYKYTNVNINYDYISSIKGILQDIGKEKKQQERE